MLDWMEAKQSSLAKPNENKCHLILPDSITERNLVYTALSKGINTNLFEKQRLETMAEMVLRWSLAADFSYLDSNVLLALIVRTVSENNDAELDFLKKLRLTNKDTLEVMRSEFFEYLRATNDGELHEELLHVAQSLDDEFARSISVACLRAFKVLREKLEKLVRDEFGANVLISRYSLLRLATQTIESNPTAISMDGVEIAVVGIWVLDAAALRFLTALGNRTTCTLRLFCAKNLYANVKARLHNASIPYSLAAETAYPEYVLCSDAVQIMKGTIPETDPKMISVPDRRREIIKAAERISELLRSGTKPNEIIILTRDSGLYLPLAKDIFPAFGIPFHVQTRLPVALLSQSQLVASILRLLSEAADDAEIQWSTLIDPIRLGICLAGKKGWPMQGPQFVYLEEELASLQSKQGKSQGLKLSEWSRAMNSTMMWSFPKSMFLTYLEWVEVHRSQPKSVKKAVDLIAKLLGAYMYSQSVWSRQTEDPRIWEPGRFRLDEMHPTYYARLIRSGLKNMETYCDSITSVTGAPPLTWKLIFDAYKETIFGKSYRIPIQDLNVVRIADVGTSWFLEAEHLFLLGMRTDEFPRTCPEGRLLGQPLRNAIAEPRNGKSAFLFLVGPSVDYGRESDFFQISLMSASEHITCIMHYLDESGHTKEWSPFLDNIKARPDQEEPSVWLPSPQNTDWAELFRDNPPWVRWRLYEYHQYRRVLPTSADAIDQDSLIELAKSIDKRKYESHLLPRVKRYRDPPTKIEIDGSEEWFSSTSLNTIAGPPFRTSELDLHATCPLQFYFYQFLFRLDSKSIDRDLIPYYSKKPHWKYGPVPRRVSYLYMSSEIENAISSTIGALGDRQSIVTRFLSSRDFRQFIETQLDSYNASRLVGPMLDDYSLVREEVGDGLIRNWAWVIGGSVVTIQNRAGQSAKIVLPSHRVDNLGSSVLAVDYVNFPIQIDKLFSGTSKIPQDYRLPVIMLYQSKNKPLAGGIYVGLYDSARRGLYNFRRLRFHKGRNGYDAELSMPPTGKAERNQVFQDVEWNELLSTLGDDVVERAKAMTPSEKITYEATPTEEVCALCVYRTLCHIPRALGW